MTLNNYRPGINSPRGLLSLIFPATVAIMISFLAPMIVGGLVDASGWSEKQAGLLISIETGVLAWSALAGLVWLNRVRWRNASLLGCVLLVLANFSSILVHDKPDYLIACRVLSGLGCGTLIALAYGSLAQTDKPHRNYGFFSVGQMLLATVCLTVLPALIHGKEAGENPVAGGILALSGLPEGAGIRAFFALMLIIALIAMCIALIWTPERPETIRRTDREEAGPVNWLFVGIMLVGIFSLMISQNGFWTYAERMGVAAGISKTALGGALAFGTLSGLVGAFSAAMIGNRFSRPLVIMAIVVLHLSALGIFLSELTIYSFLLGIFLHKFSWNFMIPYQLGMMAEVEKTGRAAVLSTFITSLGISGGAAVAALVVEDFGYRGIIYESMFFALVYTILMICVHTRLKGSAGKKPAPVG